MSRDYVLIPTSVFLGVPPDPKFACRSCGEQSLLGPFPDGSPPVCENCCDDHDYEYDRERRSHFCKNCDLEAPDDFYDEWGF